MSGAKVKEANLCFGLFSHPGRLAEEYLAHDWSATALSEPDRWPATLRYAVRLMNDAQFPMFIGWGRELSFLYNEAYLPLLADRHPSALGKPMREVWQELWPDIAPIAESALAGTPTYRVDVPRVLRKNGHAQEYNFTLSYSPIWGDDETVCGILCVVAETTQRVRLERRQALRLKVAESLRDLFLAKDIAHMAGELVGRYMHVRRAGFVEVNLADHSSSIVNDWTDGTMPSLEGKNFPLNIFGQAIADRLTEGKTAVIDDVVSHPLTMNELEAQVEFGIRSRVCVPIVKQGRLAAIFYLHDSEPRCWDAEDVAIVNGIVENVWIAIERARAEQEHLAAEERLQQGMHAARMLVWEWEIATEEAVFSENAQDILGRPIHRMDSIWELVLPEDMPRLQAAHRNAIENKGGYEELVRIVRPDTNETLWLDVRGIVQCDASGNPVAIRGITVDVSERMRTQAEMSRLNRTLAEQVHQLEAVQNQQAFQLKLTDMLRALSDPAEVFRKTGKLLGQHLKVNRALFGDYDTQQNLVTFHSEFMQGDVAALNGTFPISAFGSHNFLALASGETWVSEDLQHDPRTSGADVWPLIQGLAAFAAVAVPLSRNGTLISCLFVADGRPRAWTAEEIRLIEDTAERCWTAVGRIRAEEALRKADLHKDQFLAMLAHELRNPLAPISAAAELLTLAQLSPQHIKDTSAIIARQANHMTELINDLLDVSRVSRGLVELHREAVDMRTVVADAVEQARPLIDSRRHQLTMRIDPMPACVFGDAKRLTQVLANLLSNAAKYTAPDGRIEISMERGEEHVVLRVTDNGMGIASELMPRIFQLFVQEKRTPDRSQGGLGIGLALVKQLIELHGGSVAAASAGPQRGSQFTVLLPLMKDYQDPDQQISASNEEQAFMVRTRPQRILVVDDNRDAARMLAMLLETAGFTARVEYEAEGAMRRAQSESFDAYLLDIGLPGMDGNQLAQRLRSMPSARDALFVAITGYGQEYDREHSMQSGFDHYFIKPVDPLQLCTLLAQSNTAPLPF